MGSIEVEGYGVEDGYFRVLAFILRVFARKVLVAAPPAEEILDRTRFSQFLDQSRDLRGKQCSDETLELLLALIDGCLIDPK